MIICLAEPSASNRHAPRPQAYDADEARWESQLRRLAAKAGHVAPGPRPIIPRAAVPRRTILQPGGRPNPRDLLLLPRSLPAVTGSEDEELVCGACQAVIGARISRRSTRARHPEGRRLIIRCTCGTLVLLQ